MGNIVYSRLKKKMLRNVRDVDCCTSIGHNSFQSTVDVLPFATEDHVVKSYKYFHIYSVRVAEVEGFCKAAGFE